MKIIIISRPDFFPGEGNAINRLFQDGMVNLHLRKPECSREDLCELIKSIDPDYHSRLSLHQHHDLAAEFGIKGLHFPEKQREATGEEIWRDLVAKGYRLSTSIHDLAELERLSDAFSYTFFGPVFDSISKAGYKGVLDEDFVLAKNRNAPKVIALGGINASNIQKIQGMNFDGAALLGAVWQENQSLKSIESIKSIDPIDSFNLGTGGLSPRQLIGAELRQQFPAAIETSPEQFIAKGQSPKKSIAGGFSRRITRDGRLQFVSNENGEISHVQSILLALEAGCKWIQLRVKGRPEDEVLELAEKAKFLCDSFDAKLIINDFPHVAKSVNAYGLHLGLDDMPLREARKIVGEEMILGGTANTLQHVIQRIEEGADYVGLGPYRFTTTKQNLSPILGLEGYQRILHELSLRKCYIPIIAIGGIRQEDIAGLKAAGLYGVAMSSALINSENTKKTIQNIQQILC
ncbi:Thiamine-phosphate synthase [Dyadobacter sp. CECT 9623]|uniref:Thiamine-phosphate synthase n=1 Tax=Dyadobacter linearis TaxID=2823330 RepID=A0ABM8UNQ0_9BACT|nr:thiamine phosphate synthase [Dyadobacter sp. CECT 9623]CAG5069060.1 Thiamine-phosphate synthase [Dyadobacter sp. CECT 9623]